MTDEIEDYKRESHQRVMGYSSADALASAGRVFLQEAINHQYAYNFFWCGVPIVQIPQEIQAFQEIIFNVKPDCIVETGIAWGGSLVFSASMLCILEACGFIANGRVIGVDREIRPHNLRNITEHPLSKKISLLEGSSTEKEIFDQVRQMTANYKKILVFLDSNHSTDHVLEELKLYSSLVSVDSYCIVGDTGIDDFDNNPLIQRPWGPGNGPKKAVHEFLKSNSNFVIDKYTDTKLIATGSPDGYLKRIR